eukprot:PhF_6_TR37644/c0_g1_i2/m.56010
MRRFNSCCVRTIALLSTKQQIRCYEPGRVDPTKYQPTRVDPGYSNRIYDSFLESYNTLEIKEPIGMYCVRSNALHAILPLFQFRGSAVLVEANEDGATPLMLAAQTGKLSFIEFICEADPKRMTDTDLKGRTALHYAAVYGQKEALVTLMEYGSKWTPCDAETLDAIQGQPEIHSIMLQRASFYGQKWTELAHKKKFSVFRRVTDFMEGNMPLIGFCVFACVGLYMERYYETVLKGTAYPIQYVPELKPNIKKA